jgi:hypothetical protein
MQSFCCRKQAHAFAKEEDIPKLQNNLAFLLQFCNKEYEKMVLEQHSSEKFGGIRQDDPSFVHVPGRGAYPRASWLSHAAQNRPLRIWREQLERWESLPRSFTLPDGNHLTTLDIVSLDIGNRSAKLCAQNATHQLVTLEIPAILQPVPTNLRAGAITNTVWRVETSENAEEVWVGDEAIDGGRGFPVGSTELTFRLNWYGRHLNGSS